MDNKTELRLSRWQAYLAQKQEQKTVQKQEVIAPVERVTPFRKITEDLRQAEAEHGKATLEAATSVAVETSQQVTAMHTQQIAAFAASNQTAPNDDMDEPLRYWEAYKKAEELAKTHKNIKSYNRDEWIVLWYKWMGSPIFIFDERGNDSTFLYPCSNKEFLERFYKESETDVSYDEELKYHGLLRYTRANDRIVSMTESVLLQLLTNESYFEFGLDYKHLSPGFYLEEIENYVDSNQEYCIKFSAVDAQLRPRRKFALTLPSTRLKSVELSKDLQAKIDNARAQNDTRSRLEILIEHNLECVGLLNYFKNQKPNPLITDREENVLLALVEDYSDIGLTYFLTQLKLWHEHDTQIVSELLQYRFYDNAYCKQLLEPDFFAIISDLINMHPNARALWSKLLANHMQTVKEDDFIELVKGFLEFNEKIKSWNLTWPAIDSDLNALTILPITLGRAMIVMDACMAVDRQEQLNCLFKLDLGPCGAIMVVNENKRLQYNFISEKAAVQVKSLYDNSKHLELESRIHVKLAYAKQKKAGNAIGYIFPASIENMLSNQYDQQQYDLEFYRFIGTAKHRQSVEFYNLCRAELDKYPELSTKRVYERIYYIDEENNCRKMHASSRFRIHTSEFDADGVFVLDQSVDYSVMKPVKMTNHINELMAILLAASCGIHKARHADFKTWQKFLDLLQSLYKDGFYDGMELEYISRWFYATYTGYREGNDKIARALPVDLENTPSLPELIQLTSTFIVMNRSRIFNSISDKLTVFVGDSYYLSYKNYTPEDYLENKNLIPDQEKVIQAIIDNRLGKDESFRTRYDEDFLKTINWDQKSEYEKQAKNIEQIQRGLIKIISTFNFSPENIDSVFEAIMSYMEVEGLESTREILDYLNKINEIKPKEKLYVQHLFAFLNEYKDNPASILSDLLIKHFPTQFNEHDFTKITNLDSSFVLDLPAVLSEKLKEFSQDIRQLFTNFWYQWTQVHKSDLNNNLLEEFLFLMDVLKKEVANEKRLLVFIKEFLSRDSVLELPLNKTNELLGQIASHGIQLCLFLLQESKDRKRKFNPYHLNVLYGPLVQYLEGRSGIKPVDALTLSTELLFAYDASGDYISELLDAVIVFYQEENKAHFLSQELLFNSVLHIIKTGTVGLDDILEFANNLSLIVLSLTPELSYAICYHYQEDVDSLRALLALVKQKDKETQQLLLDIVNKLALNTSDITKLTAEFSTFSNEHEAAIIAQKQQLQAIFAKAPFPNLSQLTTWMNEGKDIQQAYLESTRVPKDYNQFDLNSVRQQEKAITTLQSTDRKSLENAQLRIMAEMLQQHMGKSMEELLEEYHALKDKIVSIKAEIEPQELFPLRMYLLSVLTAVLHQSTQPKPKQLNETQLTSLLFWMKQEGSLGLQIDTGEGKSRISMMAAAVFASEGMAVDFLTSNNQLAARDYMDFHSFFESLGIPTSLISANSPFASYQKQGINFSDGRSIRLFRGRARLTSKTALELIEVPEENRALMLDEADDTIYDQTFDRCQVSRTMAAYANMDVSWICTSAVEFVRTVQRQLREDEVYNVFDIDLNIEQEAALFKHYLMTKTPYYREFLDFEELYKDNPQHVQKEICTWLKAAITALDFKIDEDFQIKSGRLRQNNRAEFLKASDARIIAKGREDKDSRWGHWVHPCLEARLNIEREEKINQGNYVAHDAFDIDSEKAVLESSTAYDLMHYYGKGKILGVSGTMGTALEYAEAADTYSMSFYKVPRHKTNQRLDLPTAIGKNKEKQFKLLLEYMQKAQARGGAALVICKSKAEAMEFAQYCKDYLPDELLGEKDAEGNYANLQLITSEISGSAKEDKCVAKAGQKGMFTISTKMLGRGTDISVDPKHPLEVLCTYLPTIRDYWQIVGRAGRYGQKGWSRLVLNQEDLPKHFKKNDRFFTARRTYLQKEQERMSIDTIQQARLLDNCRSALLRDMTQVFYNQYHNLPKSAKLETLIEDWGELLDTMEATWAKHRATIVKAPDHDSMQQGLKDCFTEIGTAIWAPFVVKCVQADFKEEKVQLDFPSYATQLQKRPQLPKAKESYHTDILDTYDKATAGTAAIYNSFFMETKSIIKGERKLFANFRAACNNLNSAYLMADTIAIFTGDREFFANTRATIAKMLIQGNHPKMAARIMPKYQERLIEYKGYKP